MINEKWLESVFSDGSIYFVSNPLPTVGEEIIVRLRALKDSPIDHVYFRIRFNGIESLIPMEKDEVKEDLVYYACKIKVYEKVISYQFYLASKGVIYYYNQYGINDYMPDEAYDFKILTNHTVPSWVKNAVFYQIFPDRFCNGNKENDVKDNEFKNGLDSSKHINNWMTIPEPYEKARCMDFYGGDLEGITSKVPYLKELGVTALYLNPIFRAASVHHYDCLDYFHVDEHLGGDKAFQDLTNCLHENKMRILLDVSINHTGTNHMWFNKDGQFFDKSIGAYNNPDSIERSYYFFGKNNEYKGWVDLKELPTLNYTSSNLRDIIFQNKDSVVKKWLNPPYSIDGWRFDVGDTMARNHELELHEELWPLIRKSILEENKDAYIIGEDWCSPQVFLKGNMWDSAMNYFGFLRPVREFAGEQDVHNGRNKDLWTNVPMTAKILSIRLRQHFGKLPFVLQECQFNLLGSHDISRLHTNSIISWDKTRGAIIMLFTMIGATNMFYGDEADIDGTLSTMEGCRYPFPWDKPFKQTPNYQLYSALANLKKSNEAFKGSIKMISNDDYVLSYARFTERKCIISIISMDKEDRIVKVDPRVFMKKAHMIKTDLLGTMFEMEISGEEMIIHVPACQSLLIEL